MTETHAKLEITPASFNEIYEKLLKAGYECLAADGTLVLGSEIGLALEKRPTQPCVLTKRQIQVLELVTQGETNKAAAQALGLSEKTIKAHVSAIFRVLGVKNRTQCTIAYQKLLSSVGLTLEKEPALSLPNETSSQIAA